MRLVRITTNYPTYIKDFYSKNPHLKDASYVSQHREMMKEGFGWADFWDRALEPIGYEVTNYIANAEIMQKQWAAENHLLINQNNWFEEIILAQIKKFQPDILFVDDYISFSKDFLVSLKTICSSIKLTLGWCGAPFKSSDIFSAYDIVLSNIPELVLYFQECGFQAKYVRHAFSPSVLKGIDLNRPKDINFSFIGSILPGKSLHNQRINLIKKLIKDVDLELFCHVPHHGYVDKFLDPLKEVTYASIQNLAKVANIKKILKQIPKIKNYVDLNESSISLKYLDTEIVSKAKPPLFGLEMFQVLASSKISLNNHIDISRNSASNMRLFEVTGVGTCLLTDWKPNLQEIFDIDREIVTYSSIEECVEKIRWLLNNPRAIEAIAKAGQTRTLKDHTFDNRALVLDEIMQDFLKRA
jgi:spore maturation protein CgeB